MQRANVSRIILQVVAGAGLISTALIAPNALRLFRKLDLRPSSRQEEIIKRAQKRLLKQGLLSYASGHLELTAAGRRKLTQFEAKRPSVEQPKRWDRRWRILIFDIPEKKKTMRDRARRALQRVGFIHIQDSVWLYPYDCEDAVVFLKTELSIGKEMLYMIVDSLEDDMQYRKHFKLPIS